MIEPPVLRGARLELIPATVRLLRAELRGRGALARTIRARVPDNWPPELYDDPALRHTLEWLERHPADGTWGFYYFALPEEGHAHGRVLIGVGGYKGAPDEHGTVEIGYSVLTEYRRQGFATEAVRTFITRAFADARVRTVIAETLPELAPSIGVLDKCGFVLSGEGSEPGVIRYTLERP